MRSRKFRQTEHTLLYIMLLQQRVGINIIWPSLKLSKFSLIQPVNSEIRTCTWLMQAIMLTEYMKLGHIYIFSQLSFPPRGNWFNRVPEEMMVLRDNRTSEGARGHPWRFKAFWCMLRHSNQAASKSQTKAKITKNNGTFIQVLKKKKKFPNEI